MEAKSKAPAKPRVFVASSREALEQARAVSDNLSDTCHSVVWEHAFSPGSIVLEELLDQLNQNRYDFGVFLFGADDVTTIRDSQFFTVRDNVVFELGLFMAKLGRKRSFLIVPDMPDFRIPTDLHGLVWASFDPGHTGGDKAMMSTASNEIRRAVRQVLRMEATSAKVPSDLKPIRRVRRELASRAKDQSLDKAEREFHRLQVSGSEADLERAVRLASRGSLRTPKNLLNLAYQYWSLGNFSRAIQLGNEALILAEKREPELAAQARNNLAYYYAETEDPSFAEIALAHAAAAHKSRPDHPEFIDTLGYVRITFGLTKAEIQQGIRLCKKAHAAGIPDSATAKHLAKAKLRLRALS